MWYDNSFIRINSFHIMEKINKEKQKNTITPEIQNIFKAILLCPEPKVIILGKEPYKNSQANGLAFSTVNEVTPALKVIFKAMKDLFGVERINTDFSDLSRQGVLLLNSALTTEKGNEAAHLKLWQPYISALLQDIALNYPNAQWLIWGKTALHTFFKAINSLPVDFQNKMRVRVTNHPANVYFNRNLQFNPGFELTPDIVWA